jgi:capsular exopolysaccharide synthesis family protein
MGDTLPSPSSASSHRLGHDLQLDRLVGLFWRERWIILTTTVIALILGCLYVAQRGTVWQSSSRLYVERTGPSILSADNLLMTANSKNYANTQAALIRSTRILSKALDKRGLTDRKVFEGISNRIAWMKGNLKVKVGRNDDIISVSLNSTHVEDACTIVNAVVDQYIAFHASKKKTTRNTFLDHLNEQKEKHLEKLFATQKEMETFKEDNSVLGLGQDDAATFQIKRLHEVYGALDTARAGEVLSRETWFRARSLAKNPSMIRLMMARQDDGFGGVDLESSLSSRLWDLQADRALLISRVTKDHPKVADHDLQIAELEKQIALFEEENRAVAANYVTYLHETWQAARKSTEDRLTLVTTQEALVRDVTTKNIAYSALAERIKNGRQRIDELTALTEQLNLADINEGEKGLLNVMVLDPAKPETATVTTTRFGAIATYSLLGLLLGLGIAWLRGASDQRVRTVEDVTNGVHLPVLGAIPRTALPDANADAIRIWEQNAGLSEAARSLRTALYFGMPKEEGAIVQVTSADPSEGKSLISSMLAIAMAQTGQRTLIIDADLRRPTQVGLFGVRDEGGLSTALTTSTPVDELIQHTDIDNLDILTSGPIPTNPAEILNDPELDLLLAHLGKRYDRILVDSAPVVPVADSRILASKCDATILVLRAGSTSRKRANTAREIIMSVGARILGSVLNGTTHEIGYGYGNEYIYGSQRDEHRGRKKGRKRMKESV